MNGKFRRNLAEHWQKILRADPRRLFGPDYKAIRRAAFDDRRAQPGYVGSKYKPGGLVFVASNPGGAKQRKRQRIGAADREQYDLLTNLLAASPNKRLEAFETLMRTLPESMLQWNICKRYVQRIIKGLFRFSDIAFINLVKWRTVGETVPRALLEKSWESHTRDQLNLLQPSVVICLGKTVAGPFISRVYGDRVHTITIPRTRKDLRVSEEGEAAITRSRRYLRSHRKLKAKS